MRLLGALLVALAACCATATAAGIPTNGLRLGVADNDAVQAADVSLFASSDAKFEALVQAAAASAASAGVQSVGAAAKRRPGQMYAPTVWAGILKASRQETSKRSKLQDFIKIAEMTGVKALLNNPNLYATVFVPDDWAFDQLICDDETGRKCDEGDLSPITKSQLISPRNKALLKQLALSYIVPGVRFYTPMWPKWPKKVWLKTLQRGNKIGLEMDDGGPRPGDVFDVDATDDDAELIPKSWKLNLKCGRSVLHLIDDVATWKGWKNKIRCNVLGGRWCRRG